MASYVYEKALQCGSGGQLLEELRRTVLDLRRTNPELRHCSLADLSVKKTRAAINVTLYFESNSH